MQVQTLIPHVNNQRILSIIEEITLEENVKALKPSIRLISEYEQGTKLFIIKSGIVKIGITDKEKNLLLDFAVVGDVVGFSLLNNSEASFFAETLTETELFVWELAKVTELLDLFPVFKTEILSFNTSYIRNLTNRIRSLAFMNSKQRVYDWVTTYLSTDKYVMNDIWEKISFTDMARYCMVSEEEFKKQFNLLVLNGKLKLFNDRPVEFEGNPKVC